jgi:ribosomal protein S18 acetylase RimI-like enzyme
LDLPAPRALVMTIKRRYDGEHAPVRWAGLWASPGRQGMAVRDETEFRIEPARDSDTPVILRMIKALVDHEHLSNEFALTESKIRQALFGTPPAAGAVLGYVGTEPVGLAVYFPTFSTAPGQTGLYLEDLYVEPEWRRRGVGRKLFAHVAKLAAERGGGLSWSVLSWNESAIRFYQSLDAEQQQDSLSFRLTGAALDRLVEG